MAKKRANGEGNIRKRKDGRWEGRYTAGHDAETGKAIYRNVLGRTQAETKAKLRAAIEEAKSLDVTKAGKYTVGAWMDEWFENYAKIKVRPSSHQTYRGYIDNHIKPNIGKLPLEKLTSLELQKLYKKLLTSGRIDRVESKHQAKGLSPKTVRNIHQIIASAMKLAKEQKIIATDPTEISACMGGMAACNASGARSYRYGPMRPHISALRVVLANGDVLDLPRGAVRATGRHLVLTTEGGRAIELDLPTYTMPSTKNASGYFIEDDMDAVDLFIGSDGSLGVISELEVALMPVPAVTWGVSCFFADEAQAVDFTVAARPALSDAAAFEYFDAQALNILRRQRTASTAFSSLPALDDAWGCCVYVELACDGEAQALADLARLRDVLDEHGGNAERTWVARTDTDRETQRFFRHAVPESVNMLIDERRRTDARITKLGSDMSVPDDRLRDVIELYRTGLAEAGLESAAWGHIGNNHLHVNVLPRSMVDYEAGKELFGAWAAQVSAMGGAVSAEHGVGKLKRDFLVAMYGEDHVREMACVKLALDPFCQLGRGNLFDPHLCEGGE